MEKRKYLAAIVRGARLDVCAGVGITIGVLGTAVLHEWPGFVALAWGVFWALFPDLDLVPQIAVRLVPALARGIPAQWILPSNYNHRRTLLHQPYLTLPVLLVAALLLHGNPYALIAFLGALFHYLHDTPTGIAWLPWQCKQLQEYTEGDAWLQDHWFSYSRLCSVESVLSGIIVAVICTAIIAGV